MQIIRDWFNAGQHYESGVVLYEAYSPTRALMPMLRQGRSEYREKKLAAALEALIGEEKAPLPAVVKAPVPQKPAALSASAERVDPYKERWTPLYAQMNFLRHNLLNAESTEKRGEMAHEILRLQTACERFWDMRREFERTGKMPVESEAAKPEVTVITDFNKLQKRLGNLRTYISRAGKCPADEKTLVKLDKWKAELEHVETKLAEQGR